MTETPPPDRSDDLDRTVDLVRRAQDGERGALDQLIERYYPRVRRVVRRRLGARLREVLESQDIVQETFGKAVHMFDRYTVRDENSLIRWLAQIAERSIMDEYERAEAAKRNRPQEELHESQVPGDTAAATSAARREQTQLVRACLDELPRGFRDLIVLRMFDKLGWQEIAQRLGKPSPDAARVSYQGALVALERALSRRGATG